MLLTEIHIVDLGPRDCPNRIRVRIQLCALALLPVRVIENATADTRRNTRRELDRMHLITLATSAGQVAQRSATTLGQQRVLRALDMPEPPRFFDSTLRREPLNQRRTGHPA